MISKRGMWTSIVLVATGFAVFVAGVTGAIVTVAPSFNDYLNGPEFSTPLTQTVHLRQGTYVVAEDSGTQSGFGPISTFQTSAPTLSPSDIEVTDPNGQPVTVRDLGSTTEQIGRGRAIFLGVAKFDAAREGDYRVEIKAPDASVIIVRDPLDIFISALPWAGVMILGGLIGFTGVITFIVGAVRQSRRKKQQTAAAAT